MFSPPHTHQIRAEHFQTCMLIYMQFLKEKDYFFWHSETMENYIQNFRLFSLLKIRFSKIRENYYKKFTLLSYQKFASQKQCEITTKNLSYFSYQKIKMWRRAPPNQGRIFSSNFSLFSLPKICLLKTM